MWDLRDRTCLIVTGSLFATPLVVLLPPHFRQALSHVYLRFLAIFRTLPTWPHENIHWALAS